jgi:hypothetical protein
VSASAPGGVGSVSRLIGWTEAALADGRWLRADAGRGIAGRGCSPSHTARSCIREYVRSMVA